MASPSCCYILTSTLLFIFLITSPVVVMAIKRHVTCPDGCLCVSPQTATGSAPEVACGALGLVSLHADVIPRDVTKLDLSHNRLTAVDLGELLRALARLRDLNLKGNLIETISGVSEIPPRINATVDKSSDDVIRGRGYGDVIRGRGDDVTAGLEALDLSDNRLEGLEDGAFVWGAGTLTQLDLSGNRIERLGRALSDLYKLSRLDLRNNRLTRLEADSFGDLASLRYLRLDDNKIGSVGEGTFSPLQGLSYLVLRGNPLRDVIDRFRFNGSSLSYLDLSECGLGGVPRGLPPSLRYLQLRRNNITALTPASFADLRGGARGAGGALGILILDDNALTTVEQGTFTGLAQLQQLWLNGNRLTALPSPLPPSLQRLLADSNLVEGALGGEGGLGGELGGATFNGGEALTTLSLMGNKITSIAPSVTQRLARLETLDLSANLISTIQPATFSTNRRLKAIQLSKNPLKDLPLGSLDGLSALEMLSLTYLASNTSTDDKVLRDCGATLRRLELDGSPSLISQLVASPRLLRSLPALQHLSLLKSDLTHFPPHLLHSLRSTTRVSVSSSRWYCDPLIAPLRDMLLTSERDVANAENADVTTRAASAESDDVINVCAAPPSLAGRLVSSVSDAEIGLPSVTDVKESGFENSQSQGSNMLEKNAANEERSSKDAKSINATQDLNHESELDYEDRFGKKFPNVPSDMPSYEIDPFVRLDNSESDSTEREIPHEIPSELDTPISGLPRTILRPGYPDPNEDKSKSSEAVVQGLPVNEAAPVHHPNVGGSVMGDAPRVADGGNSTTQPQGSGWVESIAIDTVTLVAVCIVAGTALTATIIVVCIVRLTCVRNAAKRRKTRERAAGGERGTELPRWGENGSLGPHARRVGGSGSDEVVYCTPDFGGDVDISRDYRSVEDYEVTYGAGESVDDGVGGAGIGCGRGGYDQRFRGGGYAASAGGSRNGTAQRSRNFPESAAGVSYDTNEKFETAECGGIFFRKGLMVSRGRGVNGAGVTPEEAGSLLRVGSRGWSTNRIDENRGEGVVGRNGGSLRRCRLSSHGESKGGGTRGLTAHEEALGVGGGAPGADRGRSGSVGVVKVQGTGCEGKCSGRSRSRCEELPMGLLERR